MTSEIAGTENKEILNPERVFLVSPIMMPKWYPGDVNESDTASLSDKIRGDLAIANLKKAREAGYSVVLIHSPKDNNEFLAALSKTSEVEGKGKLIIESQDYEATYSGSRRRAIGLASNEGNCEVIVMLEIEKRMIEDIPEMISPILNKEADVVNTDRGIITDGKITNDPVREYENLRGLPRYQARSEYAFSVWANNLLKKLNIMPDDFPFIDWMGNRAWRNDPAINSKFLARYESDPNRNIFDIKPDHLSASLFFPIVDILLEGKLKLKSVPIDYRHPEIQSELENNDPNFIKKRDDQRSLLRMELVQFLKLRKGGVSSIRSIAS